MPDLSRLKFSQAPPRHDPAVPALAAHTAALPIPPDAVDNFSQVAAWPEFLNGDLGDCTVAAVGHVIQQWSTLRGHPIVATDAQIGKFYAEVSGYDGTPATDRGAAQLDVLLYWLAHGALGQKLTNFTTLELRNRQEMSDAVHWFGNAIVGLSLPKSIDGQDVWTVPPAGAVGDGAPGSLGGHIVAVVGYDPRGLTVVTWGKTMRMTWQFWEAYCVEAYAVASPLWPGPDGIAPELRAVMAALKAIAPPEVSLRPS